MEKKKLDLVFIDKKRKVYPIYDVSRAGLAEGLEKISKRASVVGVYCLITLIVRARY